METIAWSDLIVTGTGSEGTCRVCGRDLGFRAYGGLCRVHTRYLLRTGHAEGLKAVTDRAFYCAALAFAETPGDREARALLRASVAFSFLRFGPFYVAGEAERAPDLAEDAGSTAEAGILFRAAAAYADVPAEAPDAVYQEAHAALLAAAAAFLKSLPLRRLPPGPLDRRGRGRG